MKKIIPILVVVFATFPLNIYADEGEIIGLGALTDNAIYQQANELAMFEPALRAYLKDSEQLIKKSKKFDLTSEIIDGDGKTIIIMTPNIWGDNNDLFAIDLTFTSGSLGLGPFSSGTAVYLTPFNADGNTITGTENLTTNLVTADPNQATAAWYCYITTTEPRLEFNPNIGENETAEAIKGILALAGGVWSDCDIN